MFLGLQHSMGPAPRLHGRTERGDMAPSQQNDMLFVLVVALATALIVGASTVALIDRDVRLLCREIGAMRSEIAAQQDSILVNVQRPVWWR